MTSDLHIAIGLLFLPQAVLTIISSLNLRGQSSLINKQSLFTVDINCQMETRRRGVTVPLKALPGGPRVAPGQAWQSLYFLPGMHHMGLEFVIYANRSYDIPGDFIIIINHPSIHIMK